MKTTKTTPTNPLTKRMELLKPYRVGDIVEGTVIGTGRSTVYLDLGPRGTGIVYGREFLQEKETLKGVLPGDKVSGKVIDLENEDGYIELSLQEAGRQLTWERLKEKLEDQETFPVKITGANKGGLLAEMHGIQVFLPVSQLSPENYPKVEGGDPNKILLELQKFVGEELQVQVCDIDKSENKVILSERAREQNRMKELVKEYEVGQIVEGTITGLVDFGAFITFGDPPVEGLVHISEIDWQIIDDPSQFLSVGEKVQAKIIDTSNGRVSLSIKALKGDPWENISERYKKYDVVQGRVTKLNPFGAFVEVEPKIQGLSHISEFGTKQHMEELLEVGSSYPFQILELNPDEHRMTLKLVVAQASKSEETPQEEQKEEPETEQ